VTMYTVTEPYEIRPPVDEQEATADGLISVVEDRPAVRVPNVVGDEFCDRCDEILNVYMEANTKPDGDLRSGRLRDGERIRFFARFDADPDYDDGEEMKGWEITWLHHIDHIEKDIEEVARPGGAQAFATATLDQCGCEYESLSPDEESYKVEEGCVLQDVQVESISPIGDGDESEMFPDREPNEDGFVELRRTDSRPYFPDALNLWRCGILMENDAWHDRDHADD
jgi:hypothetical protein